jgi:hypothetical protein
VSAYVGWWITCAALVTVTFVLIGIAVRHSVFGVLVDFRNRMSLNNLQIVLWTILFVSTLAAIGICKGTLHIYIAPELWALMAISTGSMMGAVIIKGSKAQQQPAPGTLAAANPNRIGLLVTADKPRFSDMFKGEEDADADKVDISKLQMFFFTVFSVVGYVIVLSKDSLAKVPEGLTEKYDLYLPLLSTSLVTMIGISHMGYLTVKAAPRTAEKPRKAE